MARKAKTYSGTMSRRRDISGASSREYGRAWRRFREEVIHERVAVAMAHERSPCVDCASVGLPWVATDNHPWELHHERPITTHPELKYEQSNVVLLCKSHHRTRENREKAK